MEASARLSVRALNDALLEELLPSGRRGRTVLLGCDDQVLAAAAGRLNRTDPPDVVLRETLESVAPISSERGLRGVLRALPRPPDDLVILCACVLAASRMRPDESHSTHAYYSRLCDVLGIAPREQWPAVAGFEHIPGRFAAFADWATRSERGSLALPTDPTPSLVGVPISQTLLRRVDRDRLTALFDRHRLSLELGRDPLRILRTSSLRHELTAPAQRLLERDDLDESLRAALDAAYQGWDGTVLDDRGDRIVAARLRLGLSPGRLTLNVSLPGISEALELQGPDGALVSLPPPPGELAVPLGWLRCAVGGPAVARAADGRRLRALSGPTMLFDATDTGFWLTGAAVEGERVVLLTCEPALATHDWGRREVRASLPAGWVAVCDVDADELPEDLREPARDEDLQSEKDVELKGGLRLEPGVWLLDHPPVISGSLREPAVVEARRGNGEWRELGEVLPDEPFALAAIEHEA